MLKFPFNHFFALLVAESSLFACTQTAKTVIKRLLFVCHGLFANQFYIL